MIRLRDIPLPPEHNAHQLRFEAAQLLRISNSRIRQVKIVRRSVDARKKPDIKIIYTIDVAVDGNEKRILKQSGCKRATIAPVSYYKVPKPKGLPKHRPVIVGFGPAGMFAALILAINGLCPIVLERGDDAVTRHEKIKKFWQTGELGKVDQGGGGTVAKFVAALDVDTIDIGVPVLSMHAPIEVVAKTDVYMTYRAFYEFLKADL